MGAMNKEGMDAFLGEKQLARLATVSRDGRPHVVPVWFGWDGETLWISSYSDTRKVQHLRKTPYCSVVIDETDERDHTRSVIMEGKAELVTGPRDFLCDRFTWIYVRYLGGQGVLAAAPQEWIQDPRNLLIRLHPEKIISWEW